MVEGEELAHLLHAMQAPSLQTSPHRVQHEPAAIPSRNEEADGTHHLADRSRAVSQNTRLR